VDTVRQAGEAERPIEVDRVLSPGTLTTCTSVFETLGGADALPP